MMITLERYEKKQSEHEPLWLAFLGGLCLALVFFLAWMVF